MWSENDLKISLNIYHKNDCIKQILTTKTSLVEMYKKCIANDFVLRVISSNNLKLENIKINIKSKEVIYVPLGEHKYIICKHLLLLTTTVLFPR